MDRDDCAVSKRVEIDVAEAWQKIILQELGAHLAARAVAELDPIVPLR
jgi:hypothetical protein